MSFFIIQSLNSFMLVYGDEIILIKLFRNKNTQLWTNSADLSRKKRNGFKHKDALFPLWTPK